MEFKALAKKRYSCRSYLDTPPDDELIQDILDTAHWAPSAVNRQPWRYLVIREAENLKKITRCYKREWLQTAPCIIVVIGRPDEAWTRRYDDRNSINEDLAITMDHLLLAAAEKGLGSCWIGNFDPEMLREILDLDEGEVAEGFTPLGYPADLVPEEKKRKELASLINWS